MAGDVYFQVTAINGLLVRTTKTHWQRIVNFKHPVMKDREEDVKLTLENPDEIRQSKQNARVLLYYRKSGDYHTCVVVRTLDGEAFIITTYVTDRIKEGKNIWKT